MKHFNKAKLFGFVVAVATGIVLINQGNVEGGIGIIAASLSSATLGKSDVGG